MEVDYFVRKTVFFSIYYANKRCNIYQSDWQGNLERFLKFYKMKL